MITISAEPVETILNEGSWDSGMGEHSDTNLHDLQGWAQEKWKNRQRVRCVFFWIFLIFIILKLNLQKVPFKQLYEIVCVSEHLWS